MKKLILIIPVLLFLSCDSRVMYEDEVKGLNLEISKNRYELSILKEIIYSNKEVISSQKMIIKALDSLIIVKKCQ